MSITKKWINIGNRNIKMISYNGNIELKREKYKLFKGKKENKLPSREKRKEKNNNNLKNT